MAKTNNNELTKHQRAFVDAYLCDPELNGADCVRKAGYRTKYPDKVAYQLLENPRVIEAIQKAREKTSAKVEITAEQVLQRMRDIAFADPNELIHFRRTCCRYCFGHDHAYQWTDESEHAAAQAAEYASAKKAECKPKHIDDSGGYGYDPTIRPHPKCPKCHGEGVPGIHAEDTRELSPAAKALYAGVKQTASGYEVLMHDQVKALEMLAKYHGLLKDKVEHTGKDGEPLSVVFNIPRPPKVDPDG